MVIKYGAAPKRFQSKWDTTQAGSANDTVVLPLRSDGLYDFRIDWGDGKANRDDITVYNQSEVTHQYDDTGVYTIKIVGDIKGWYFNAGGDDDKIMEVSSWGPLILTLPDSFEGCSNLESTATDKLVISTTNATRMFYQCFMGSGGNVNLWDISNITNMTQFFYGTRFDQPIGDWNVSNVTNMQNMFAGTTNINTTIPFDQDLGNWDVSSVTRMDYMFQYAKNFNNGGSSSITGWDTSSVTNMSSMFYDAYSFNQPIGTWDVSNVTDMGAMFYGRRLGQGMSFDQDLGAWDVGNVTNMNSMFGWLHYQSNAFNNGGSPSISGWNTSNVTNMGGMFYRCTGFNQPIGSWDTSKVTNMSEMLKSCYVFDQPIGNWNTSKVTNMSSMFHGGGTVSTATTFNQDIGNWDVTGVTNMQSMFRSCKDFNNGGSTGINNWRPSSCTNM